MNILFVSRTTWDPQKGGIERVSVVLATYFTEQGHAVSFLNTPIAQSPVYNGETLPGRSYTLPHPLSAETYTENLAYFEEIVAREKIGYIIYQHGDQEGFMDLIHPLCQSRQIRLVSCCHNDLFHFTEKSRQSRPQLLRWIKAFRYRKKQRKLLAQVGRNVLKSDRMVLLADTFVRQITPYLPEKERGKVCRIYNPSPETQGREILRTKDQTILFIGRMSSVKQPLVAIRIWEKMASLLPSWKFVMLGDGRLGEQVRKYIDAHHIPNITMEGFQIPDPYLAQARILLSTSKSEGYSLATVEAMSHGVVPASFAYTPTAEIFEDGEEGVILSRDLDKAANQLYSLCRNEEKLQRMSEKALARSTQTTLKVIGNTWIELLGSL